jgi:hypothetical protein
MFARSRRSEGSRLPQGAEAALWSIVEVIPDPRNHLALTRDPTCEIRLSAAQIEAAAAAPVPAAVASASPMAPAASQPAPVPTGVRWSPDAAPVGPDPQARPDEVHLPETGASLHDLPTWAARNEAPSEEELIRALFAESA